jgi:uncharacterized membrane protein
MERRLDLLTLALTVAGIALAGYLTIVHYRANLLVCGISSCHTVQASKYAVFLGIPVALLGLAMYVALAGLALLRLRRPARADQATYAVFLLAFAGLLFSGYLTAIELWVINAICQWCVVSAILVTVIAVIEGWRVWRLLGAGVQ